MSYKAVIFDLDGTLLNTIGDIAFMANPVWKKHLPPGYSTNRGMFTEPYPGIIELLDKLNELGIKTAILSNKDHQRMPGVLKTHFAQQDFSVAFGARIGIPSKPSPDGALEIAAIWGLSPQEILYVGDSDLDMQTAVGAGMYPIGALWGLGKEADLLGNGAKTLLELPGDLLKMLA